MEEHGGRRWKWRWLGVPLLAVLVALVIATWLNVSGLARKVTSGSVPGFTFQYLDVGWNAVQLRGGRYQLPGPTTLSVACTLLRAEPSFLSFLTDRIRVADVEVEQPRFRIERTGGTGDKPPGGPPASNGPQGESPAGKAPRSVAVRRLVLKGGSGTFIDRTVGNPPAQIQFVNLEATLTDLELPEDEGPSQVTLTCAIHGDPDGSFNLGGWFDPAAGSADLTLRLADCDLNLLHPYLKGELHTVSETSGRADLDLAILMTAGIYEAKGELRLHEMNVPDTSDRFLGIPASLLREYLRLGSNRLTIPFTFRGNVNEEPFPPDMGTILAGALSGRLKIKSDITPEQLDKIDKGLKKLKDLLR